MIAAKWAVVAADKAKAKAVEAVQVSWGVKRKARRAARKAAAAGTPSGV